MGLLWSGPKLIPRTKWEKGSFIWCPRGADFDEAVKKHFPTISPPTVPYNEEVEEMKHLGVVLTPEQRKSKLIICNRKEVHGPFNSTTDDLLVYRFEELGGFTTRGSCVIYDPSKMYETI